jgi:hypothetical protein
MKYAQRSCVPHVTWNLHQDRKKITNEVKVLLHAIEDTKKVPGGERPAAQKKRTGRLSSMQEALSLCEKIVLKCTDWAPNMAKQVWDLILIGVEGNDTFHEYDVTRDVITDVFG